jgi:hypothetical protein
MLCILSWDINTILYIMALGYWLGDGLWCIYALRAGLVRWQDGPKRSASHER